ncbi:Uncharacterised protein [Serratia marcescens]|nr:Uncharacterised protein [Serratia marcescens]
MLKQMLYELPCGVLLALMALFSLLLIGGVAYLLFADF